MKGESRESLRLRFKGGLRKRFCKINDLGLRQLKRQKTKQVEQVIIETGEKTL